MKRFKLIVWILGLIWIISFSYWAELRITPGLWVVWKNCVNNFSVYLILDEWEKAFSSDLQLKSNMEFVNFENWDLFDYYIPPVNTGWTINIIMLNSVGHNVMTSWLVWKIYYKSIVDEDPYINFQFDWIGMLADTNVAIDWMDILKNTLWWNYYLDFSVSCEEFTWNYYDPITRSDIIDEIINDIKLTDDEKIQWNNDNQIFSYKIILLSSFVLLIIILLFYMLVKKWKNQ